MEKPYPEWFEVYGKQRLEASSSIVKGSFSDIEWSEVKIKILDLAGTEGGCSERWIVEKHGTETGLESAYALVEAGVLKKVGNRFFTTESEYTDFNSVSVLQRIAIQASSFDHNRIGLGCWYQRFTELFPIDLSLKAKNCIRKFVTEIEEIKKEARNSTAPKTELMVINMFGEFETLDGLVWNCVYIG